MTNYTEGRHTAPLNLEENLPRLILTRFVRATLTMRDMDELFQWITNLMIQQFRARVAQVWATHQPEQGSAFLNLRSLAKQDQSLPESLTVNSDIAAVAENILREGRPPSCTLVNTTLPASSVRLFSHYGLNYYANSFLSNPAFLLPPATKAMTDLTPVPLAATLLLFFRKAPLQKEILVIDEVFQNILPVAKSRGLLLAAPVRVPPPLARESATLDLFELIPYRNEDSANGLSASAMGLSDKRARNFYAAINGRKTVRELATLAHLDRKEVPTLLERLVSQGHVKLYQPEGRVVEDSRIFGRRSGMTVQLQK